MRKFTVILTLLFFSVSSLFANNGIQVYTTNTMHLTIDKSKVKKLFVGEKKVFLEESQKVNSQLIKEGAVAGGLSVGAAGAAAGSFQHLDSNGGLVGLAAIAAITVGKIGYDYLSSSDIFDDYEYLFIAEAQDKNENKTLLYTYIISEDKLTNEELKKLSLDSF